MLYYQVYYDTFHDILNRFTGVTSPWSDFKDFSKLATEKGYLAIFCWLVPSFSPCVYAPKIVDRFIHIFKKAVEFHPAFFN